VHTREDRVVAASDSEARFPATPARPALTGPVVALLRAPIPSGWGTLLVLLPAIALGLIVRGAPVLASDFPLHDGGLFASMVKDLQRAGFGLPMTTSYNNAGIPFAYPPLGIYMTALFHSAGLDLSAVMRFLPVLFSVATIPLAYAIVRELTDRRGIAAVAAVAYALAPRSYEWLIVGGGVTRAPGVALSFLAVWSAIRLLRHPSYLGAAATGVISGMTLLTHPEASVFLVASVALLFASRGRTWRAAILLAGAALVALTIAAPWWLTVVSRDGWMTLLGAMGSRSSLIGSAARDLLFGHFTGAEAFDVFLGVGFVGLLADLGRGRFLLAAWMLVLTVALPDAGFTYAMLPWSVLIGIGVVDVVVPGMDVLTRSHRLARPTLVAGLLGAAVLASLATPYGTDAPVHALTSDQRAAMTWVSEYLPADAQVAVITNQVWWNDAISEWFPELTDRQSVATVQGYEWTTLFARQERRDALLQDVCALRTVACLRTWVGDLNVAVQYVFVPKGHLAGPASSDDCCAAMRISIRDNLTVVYDGPGATVARLF
jgi:4-amino-4-deoxy-L-arabinose transferase-like glycosyltransferase